MEKFILVLPILSIIITLFLAFFVFFKDVKKIENILFFLMFFTLSLWMIFNFSEDVPELSNYSDFFVKLDFAFAPLSAYLFYLFSQVFPEIKWHSLLERILVFVLSLILLMMPFLGSSLIKSVDFIDGSKIIFSNTGILLYSLILSVLLFSACYIILNNYRRLTGLEKKQTYYLLLGFVILIIFLLLSNLFLPIVFINMPLISRFGYIGVIAFATMCSYAILKHHLFDIRVILTETATAIVVFALLIQTLTTDTLSQKFVSGIILIIVTYGGYLLIKSVQDEIRKKEQLQTLSNQLEHANEHLKELDAMKTEFVSLASHELLTPVSAIEGYLSMLLDEKLAKVDDPKAVDYLNHVYSSAKRLARLVTDMLNVSRIEEGRLLVEKKEVDLSELVKQVAEELKFKAEEGKQKITFENPDGWMTFGDADKIKEVIVNIIGNSIKYSKNPGEITIKMEKVSTDHVQEMWAKVEADIKARPLDDQEAIKSAVDESLKRMVGQNQILIHIKDQGIGIPKEELPRLFKKFHRVGDYTTAESQGTGLGLYISRALVELHHGRIWADSEGQSHGSTFTFSLPEATSKQEIETLEAEVPKKEGLKPLARPTKAAEEI